MGKIDFLCIIQVHCHLKNAIVSSSKFKNSVFKSSVSRFGSLSCLIWTSESSWHGDFKMEFIFSYLINLNGHILVYKKVNVLVRS